VAIAISGSGNSVNVLKAIKTAKAKGAVTVGFTGFKGGKLKELVDCAVIVDAGNIEQVENVHLILDHILKRCLQQSAGI
jgi:D-sedoheptulose 7-phosphate isomerase